MLSWPARYLALAAPTSTASDLFKGIVLAGRAHVRMYPELEVVGCLIYRSRELQEDTVSSQGKKDFYPSMTNESAKKK